MILEDEFLNFLRKNFPHFKERMVSLPGMSFQYSLPGNQHGIPSKAKEIRQEKVKEEKVNEAGSNLRVTPTDVDNMRGGKQKKKPEKTLDYSASIL